MALWKCPRGIDQLLELDIIYPCFSSDNQTKLINSKCNEILLLSSIRSNDPVTFPDIAGLDFGHDDIPFMILETHLINTMDMPLNLSVGFKIWMTSENINYN